MRKVLILSTAAAVSYTHLDVYKRQALFAGVEEAGGVDGHANAVAGHVAALWR